MNWPLSKLRRPPLLLGACQVSVEGERVPVQVIEGEFAHNVYGDACTAAQLRWCNPFPSARHSKAKPYGKVVHVFDPAGHPTATRAYAWSFPIEGSTKRRFFAVLLSQQSKARKLRCARRSWRNRGGGSEQQINRRPAYDDLSTRSGGGGSRCSPGGSYPGA